jgi:hypothetical protein
MSVFFKCGDLTSKPLLENIQQSEAHISRLSSVALLCNRILHTTKGQCVLYN